ncbi:hypothetical protein GDO81_008656 [Engystomops pustulosus]|uniref:Aprataxin and PNK-like factor n=1 Tax=Engystomops pustulosus TaxID=76066 RepID=A0AAV7CIV5_ENGPU|nr:hypothetical protein GDO81_008656 [Engystomops pustulosus]KAG8584042.1 hypothetical protein GDO81_008656 [Engystomops pustulosus]KAG8584043.1 hypothetical protein GDO81_008656 [Engystomops pustulosus]
MSRYELEAADGGGRFPIPEGETVIGRGPVLGIADKRVSRSHAVLEVVDDKLRIKSIHVNPCFYQSSGKSTFVPLDRNVWTWLHSGDCVALLPDKCSFKVIAKAPPEEATLRNSQHLDEDAELNDGAPPSPITSERMAASPPRAEPPSSKRTNGCDVSTAPSSKHDVEPSKPAERKRVLPSWMLQGELPVQPLPSHVVTAGKKRKVTTSRTRATFSHKTKDEDSCGKQQPKASLPSTSSSSPKMATAMVDIIEEDMEEEKSDDTPKVPYLPSSNSSLPGSPSTSDNKPTTTKTVKTDSMSLSPASSQNTQQSQKKRTPCMYGEQCYRKNPVHFQEFSHPGDSDYNDAENGSQDDNDDRPECPYGTDCYRKNPQHKLEYKHTRPPGRKLRKRNPKKAKRSVVDGDSDDDGEANDYDLEDSFIDDDDEEEDFDITDEDSDWMPDSEDKDSEDVKQLMKEAKKFMRAKR